VPEALEVVSYTLLIDSIGARAGGDGATGGIEGLGMDSVDVDGALAEALAAELGPQAADALEETLPVALEAFLRQAEVDPDLQEALSTAADAAAVAEIAREAGFEVGEADLWGASDETPEALQEPQLNPPAATELADPWGVEERSVQKG